MVGQRSACAQRACPWAARARAARHSCARSPGALRAHPANPTPQAHANGRLIGREAHGASNYSYPSPPTTTSFSPFFLFSFFSFSLLGGQASAPSGPVSAIIFVGPRFFSMQKTIKQGRSRKSLFRVWFVVSCRNMRQLFGRVVGPVDVLHIGVLGTSTFYTHACLVR